MREHTPDKHTPDSLVAPAGANADGKLLPLTDLASQTSTGTSRSILPSLAAPEKRQQQQGNQKQQEKNNDLLLTRRSSTHLQSQAETKASEDQNHPWLHSEL